MQSPANSWAQRLFLVGVPVDWKYCIPHTWESGNRTPWADIWLMPQDPRFRGRSVPLTIDALGDSEDPTHGDDRSEFQKEALQKLGDKDYWISGAEMIVRARDFSREEFLEWVKVWIRNLDPNYGELIPGSYEEFNDTSREAKLIDRLLREYPDASAGR